MRDTRTPGTRIFPGESPAEPLRPRQRAPELALEVVEWLERLAPEPNALDYPTDRELLIAHGRRAVALRARAEYNRQQDKE